MPPCDVWEPFGADSNCDDRVTLRKASPFQLGNADQGRFLLEHRDAFAVTKTSVSMLPTNIEKY